MTDVKIGQLFTVVGVLVVFSACTTVDDFLGNIAPTESIGCEDRTTRQLQGVDFTSTPRIEMIIRRGEFSPMILRMTKGRTYALRLRNRDGEAHAFHAPDFFDSIAVSAVAIDNDILPTICPGPVVVLQPGQSFEMQFLAVTDGVYEYRDTESDGFSIGNLLNAASPGGLIRIEESY